MFAAALLLAASALALLAEETTDWEAEDAAEVTAAACLDALDLAVAVPDAAAD